MQGSPTIAFYLTFGYRSGLGHLVRSGALALACKLRGAKAVLVTDEPATLPSFFQDSYDEHLTAKDLSSKKNITFTHIVIDHYKPYPATLDLLRENLPFEIQISDDPKIEYHESHLVICPTLSQTSSYQINNYKKLIGSDFSLLRPAFPSQRLLSSKLKRRKELSRVFLTLGGTDPARLTPKLAEQILSLGLVLDITSSSYSRDWEHLVALKEKYPDRVYLHRDANDLLLASILSQVDLAIGNTGSTTFEWCTLGTPGLVIRAAENQNLIYDEVLRAGAALDGGNTWDKDVVSNIRGTLRQFIECKKNLSSWSDRAYQLCDGLGAYRAAGIIFPTLTKNFQRVHLRLAKSTDIDFVYNLQTRPETRRFSRNPKVPTYNEHIKWFRGKISDPSSIFSIISVDNQDQGVLRLDSVGAQSEIPSCEVSIFIEPAFFGKGIAEAALKEATLLVPFADLTACVLPQNIASIKLFEKAGFLKDRSNYYRRKARFSLCSKGESFE